MAKIVSQIFETLPGLEEWVSKNKKERVFEKGSLPKRIEILNEFLKLSQGKISFSTQDGNPYFLVEKGGGSTKVFSLSKRPGNHLLQVCEHLKAA